jgi:two-component system, OmpR family, phosphate regulon sensor histidine kinase PhoR
MDQSVTQAIKVVNSNVETPPKEFFDVMLKEVEKFMNCPISYFVSVEDNEKVLITRWTSNLMDACAVVDKPLVNKIENIGIWGDCVRERKPVIINDYHNCERPNKKGYPEGHLTIQRHMNVPVFEGETIVGILGVGNKTTPFDDSDSEKMTDFMKGVWEVVKTKCV